MKKEPIRHHYIPQFILRNFCDEEGNVKYFDKASGKIIHCEPRDIFMEKNLYRDEINHTEDPTKIEKDLSIFENEISKLIKEKFLVGDNIILTAQEEEKLKVFLAIMGFRAYNTQLQFESNKHGNSVKLYSYYQKNEDYIDMWKRNLGYLVNCRSVEEIWKHPHIDDPIKILLTRDTLGILGLYLVVVENKENGGFIIGDSYPAEVSGITMQGFPVLMYAINPISSNRAILVVANGCQYAPREVIGFRPTILNKPRQLDSGEIQLRVKKLYPEEVKVINKAILDAAKMGYVFCDNEV